jgi:hypothetical protein
MMEQAPSVVTPERFIAAMTYEEYVRSIAVNRDQFQRYYDMASLSDEDVAFFRRAGLIPSGPAKILVIAEPWCPDVFRGVPVFLRIAEASGLELRLVARDQNPDIMDEFLLDGRARAIPVAIFYTADMRYLTHWTERPVSAQAEIKRLRAEFSQLHPNADMATMKAFYDARLPQQYPAWQVETVREIRELLSTVLHCA